MSGVTMVMKPKAIDHWPTTVSSSSRQNQIPRKKPKPRWTTVINNMTIKPVAKQSAANDSRRGELAAVTVGGQMRVAKNAARKFGSQSST